MKSDINKSKMLVCLLSCGMLTLGTGCTDNDFDLSKIDTTIGIGGNELTLPTNSTENIMLDDVLELNNSDLVYIAENGDYMFKKEGDDCAPAHPLVDKVDVSQTNIKNLKIEVTVPSSVLLSARKSPNRLKKIDEVKSGGKVAEFEYVGKTPKEIKEITSAGVSADVVININLTDELKQFIPTFKTLTMQIPSYMHLNVTSCSEKNYSYDKNTGKITLTNVKTASPIYIKGMIDVLDFKTKGTNTSKLTFKPGVGNADGTVDMKGEIETSIVFDEVNATAGTIPTNMYLSAKMTMGKITINSAKGKFDPEIDLGDLGNIEINDVPDFLTGDDVHVNLYNPVLELEINSDIAIAGTLKGNIVAKDKNNKTIAQVAIPTMNIKPNATTRICICKYPDDVNKSKYDEVKKVDNLSDILATIPKTIQFEADANADATKEAEIKLGHQYTITPKYNVSAPLAFDAGAQITYRDTLDGWNDDIKDCELAEGSYIELMSDIENKLPAYLKLSSNAIDVDGNEIAKELIEVKVSNMIEASTDGTIAKTTPVTITISEKKKGMLKKVDGLTFKIEVAADDNGNNPIVGKTINAYNHTITAKNIKVKLVGKIIADFN